MYIKACWRGGVAHIPYCISPLLHSGFRHPWNMGTLAWVLSKGNSALPSLSPSEDTPCWLPPIAVGTGAPSTIALHALDDSKSSSPPGFITTSGPHAISEETSACAMQVPLDCTTDAPMLLLSSLIAWDTSPTTPLPDCLGGACCSFGWPPPRRIQLWHLSISPHRFSSICQ